MPNNEETQPERHDGPPTHFRRPTHRRQFAPPSTAIAVAAGLLALGIGAYWLNLPHVLTGVLGWNEGYDEGVYVGSATRFVNGVLPYRDFVFVQPPGIVLLLAPVALVGRLAGTTDVSLAIARCLTTLTIATNVVLAGLVVRPAGRLAVGITSFLFATWLGLVWIDPRVELEPYLVFFDLLGALLLFRKGDLATDRRVLLAGVCFGFAAVVKVWGVLPILAVIIICLARSRRKTTFVAAGVLLGGLPCVPFLLAAPHAFLHEVIADQLTRNLAAGTAPTTFTGRLLITSGVRALQATGVLHDPTPIAVVVSAVFLAAVIAVFATHRRRLLLLEWYCLVAAAIVYAGMFVSEVLNLGYAYFPVSFLVLLVGPVLSRLLSGVGAFMRAQKLALAGHSRIVARLVAAAAALAVLSFLVENEVSYGNTYLAEASNPAPALDSVIPPGSCVVSDYYVDLLAANRFTPSGQGCPAVVDPFGMYLAEDHGLPPHPSPPYPVEFQIQWFDNLASAQYVELKGPFSDSIPWTSTSMSWFAQNYRLVGKFITLYSGRTLFDSYKAEYVYKSVTSTTP